MKTLAILVLAFGCAAAGDRTDLYAETSDQTEPEERLALPSESVLAPDSALPGVDFGDASRAMLVNPEPGLLPYVNAAIEHYKRRLGVSIMVSEKGIPIRFAATLGTPNHKLAGESISDVTCSYDECNNQGDDGRIWISETRSQHIQHVIEHELGHTISAWGNCTTEQINGHINPDAPGDVMSTPSGSNWGPESVKLLCSCGACSQINSDEMKR